MAAPLISSPVTLSTASSFISYDAGFAEMTKLTDNWVRAEAVPSFIALSAVSAEYSDRVALTVTGS